MNDSINATPPDNRDIDAALRRDADRIPAPADGRLVSRVMHAARSRPRRHEAAARPNRAGLLPWLLAGATATAAIAVTLLVTDPIVNSSVPGAPRPLAGEQLAADVEPLLASPERDLAGELQRIRADLGSLGRMVSVRLESDAE